MRSRKTILESCTYKKQFQGTPTQAAILETLLDIRQCIMFSTAQLTEQDLEEHEKSDKGQ